MFGINPYIRSVYTPYLNIIVVIFLALFVYFSVRFYTRRSRKIKR